MKETRIFFDIDINQDEIGHAASKLFHGYSVQTKDFMSENNCWICYHRDSSRRWDDQILIGTLHLDTMSVKRKREMDETFLLYDVYTALFISNIPDILKSTP